MTIAGAVFVVAAVVALVLHERNTLRHQQSSFAQMTISPVTTTGNIHSTTVSADGKWMAYVQDDHGGHGIWVRQLATGSAAQVLPGSPGEIVGLVFAADGNYLYYAKRDPVPGVNTLYQVPSLGGSPRVIHVDVDSPISFAPDNKRFVFVRYNSKLRQSQLIIAKVHFGSTATSTAGCGDTPCYWPVVKLQRPRAAPKGAFIQSAGGMPEGIP